MRKNLMREIAICAVCVSTILTIGHSVAYGQTEQSQQIYHEGMAYIPDRSVYFADVNLNYDWAFHQIDYLANTGIVSGTGNFIYRPENSLTRADFVLMLYRAYDMKKYASGDNFVDVSPNAYYAQAVQAAKTLGIAMGDKNGKFYSTQPLTRQDAMVLLKRTLDRTNLQFQQGDLSKFADANQVSPYAEQSVSALIKAGVIEGKNGKISPKTSVTRAEMAVMLYRALHLRAIGDQAVYLHQPAVRLICVGSTIYADVLITDFDKDAKYAGLYELHELTKSETGYRISLGEQQPIDDEVDWDGQTLKVNGKEVPVAPDCEAIVVDMYSKREAGLCSTGKEYRAAAVSMVDGQAQTVYYKK